MKVIKENREYGIFLLDDGFSIVHPAWPTNIWNIGDVRDIETRRKLSDDEVKKYMNLIEPEIPWEKAREKLWRSCSSLGDPGTKEKEKNIQTAILEQGKNIV